MCYSALRLQVNRAFLGNQRSSNNSFSKPVDISEFKKGLFFLWRIKCCIQCPMKNLRIKLQKCLKIYNFGIYHAPSMVTVRFPYLKNSNVPDLSQIGWIVFKSLRKLEIQSLLKPIIFLTVLSCHKDTALDTHTLITRVTIIICYRNYRKPICGVLEQLLHM